MLSNAEMAATFDRMADLLEFQGANAFRVRAYRNGSRAIQGLTQSVARLVEEDFAQLVAVEGIGKSVAEKCEVLARTGSLPQLEALLRDIPAGVLALLRIPGLGPKKAAILHRELGIVTLEQLKKACETEQVRQLKGFGPKTETLILRGMHIAEAAGKRMYWAHAEETVLAVQAHLQACSAVARLAFAGSYRRGKETVGDLDALVVSSDHDRVMNQLETFPTVAETIGRGETKMSVRLEAGLQIDLRVVAPESFGAAMQYFTGSKEHNVLLRGRAKRRGLKVNEYGVFREEENQPTYVAGASEMDVYSALGLPWIPPELREARREFEWADADALPELITPADLQGDLHMHTTETDGLATLEEMVAGAKQRGLQYVAITDHSQRVTMAQGLDPNRLLAQWSVIDQLNRNRNDEFLVLKGIEVDILENGRLDLPDDVLMQADWVVASLHYGQNQSKQQITERLLAALENPNVCVIAHPTGRLIDRRDPYPLDIETVLQAARDQGKMMEINAHPARLDLNDVHAATAKEWGIPIVISTDAHNVADLDVMRYGVLQARRAGLTRHDVANAHPWHEIHKMLERPRGVE